MSSLPYNILKQLEYTVENSIYYKNIFNKHNLNISEIKTENDFEKIPFTTKEDLQVYNQSFLAIPKSKIAEIVTTSGTLGKPVTFYLSDNDISRLAINEYQSLTTAGVTPEDVVQITTTLDKMFMAGIAYYLGLRKIGASIIRVGPGNPALQWQNIISNNVTVLIAVPSFVLKLIEYAKLNNIGIQNTSLKKIICIGESIRTVDLKPNQLAKNILEHWDVQLYSTYASTEISTAFTECNFNVGGHIIEELVYIECVDSNGHKLPDGQIGELVATTIGVEGTPLLRYKTGDISFIINEKCDCGKITKRIGPILGRKQQMIKLKGTTIYPNSILEVVRAQNYIKDFIIEISQNNLGLDVVNIIIATTTSENIQLLRAEFKAKLRVTPEIQIKDAHEITKLKNKVSFRKPVEIIDLR